MPYAWDIFKNVFALPLSRNCPYFLSLATYIDFSHVQNRTKLEMQELHSAPYGLFCNVYLSRMTCTNVDFIIYNFISNFSYLMFVIITPFRFDISQSTIISVHVSKFVLPVFLYLLSKHEVYTSLINVIF